MPFQFGNELYAASYTCLIEGQRHQDADALYAFKSRGFGGEYVGHLLLIQYDQQESIHVLLSHSDVGSVCVLC